jgi:hypothetical protein
MRFYHFTTTYSSVTLSILTDFTTNTAANNSRLIVHIIINTRTTVPRHSCHVGFLLRWRTEDNRRTFFKSRRGP